jgi:hypothetical protein
VVLTDEGWVVPGAPGLGVGEGGEGERPAAAAAPQPLLVPSPPAPPPLPLLRISPSCRTLLVRAWLRSLHLCRLVAAETLGVRSGGTMADGPRGSGTVEDGLLAAGTIA